MFEVVSVVMSSAAIIISVIALVNYWFILKDARAKTEIEMRNCIFDARAKLFDVAISFAENQSPDEETYSDLYQMAFEEILSAYDEICMKYIDKKVDKKRFEKKYSSEIKNLVENEPFNEYLNTRTKYRAIICVYEKFNNLEKT